VRRLILAAVVLISGCSNAPAAGSSPSVTAASAPRTGSSASTTATASPISINHLPAAGPLGVLVDYVGQSAANPNGPTYSVLLVDTTGKTVAQVQGRDPLVYSFPVPRPSPPLVSVTTARLYYVDRDAIRFIDRNGSTGVARPYPGGAKSIAGFAVSPDDKRIAIGLLTFPGAGLVDASLDLYVEDLAGGNRVELFSSTTVREWPVAWDKGHIVVAVGPAVYSGSPSGNPYSGTSGYHVADATTGNRLVAMQDDCTLGPLTGAGSACLTASSLGAQAFDGTYRFFSVWPPAFGTQPGPPQAYSPALSPDGAEIALRDGASFAEAPIYLFTDRGYLEMLQPGTNNGIIGAPIGWIDPQHLVFGQPPSSSRSILVLDSQQLSPVVVLPIQSCACDSSGVFFGRLPAA